MMKKKQRHFTPEEIKQQCKMIAQQRRTSDRSPWTALNIVTAYALMTVEGFKGQKIQSILGPVSDKFMEYTEHKLDIKEYSDKLFEKAGWTIDYEAYTQADVKGKKGSYVEWINSKQLDPVNSINSQSTAFLILFFNELMKLGYGEKRLSRIKDKVCELYREYENTSGSILKWRTELMDNAGIAFENPKDPYKN